MTHINEEKLNEYLDGSLDETARIEVEHHFASCMECRQSFDDLRLVFSALKDVRDVQPPADLSGPILAEIRLEQAKRIPTWLLVVLGLQATLAIILFLFLWPSTQEMMILAGRGLSEAQAILDIRLSVIQPIELVNQLTSDLAQASDTIQLPFLLSTGQWMTLVGLALIVWLVGNGLFLRGKSRE